MQHYKLWLLSYFSIFFWSLAHAKCYFPNGKEMSMPGVIFFECDSSSQEHTMCCGKGDECRPDGLCDSNWYGQVFRNGCSDPTWKSPSCVKLCDSGFLDVSVWNGEVKDLSNSGVPVTLCDDGSYCCGDGAMAETCCTSRQGVFLRNGSSIPHYAVPSSAISAAPIPLSTVSVSYVESFSDVVTTTLISSEIPSSLTVSSSSSTPPSAASDNILSTSSAPSSSSANKSFGDGTGAMTIFKRTIGSVMAVLVFWGFGFGNWRAPLILWWNKNYLYFINCWDIERREFACIMDDLSMLSIL